jgi:hypothetical protein
MADEQQPPSSTGPEGDLSFIGFVYSLAHTAALHFGDIPDPQTGQPGEMDLEGAKGMIDILTLLEVKTRGNLTAEERQFLEQVLFDLRLRFVEAGKPQSRIITP